MKVKELIAQLQGLNQESVVMIYSTDFFASLIEVEATKVRFDDDDRNYKVYIT